MYLIQMYTDTSLPMAHSSAGSQTDILCLFYSDGCQQQSPQFSSVRSLTDVMSLIKMYADKSAQFCSAR